MSFEPKDVGEVIFSSKRWHHIEPVLQVVPDGEVSHVHYVTVRRSRLLEGFGVEVHITDQEVQPSFQVRAVSEKLVANSEQTDTAENARLNLVKIGSCVLLCTQKLLELLKNGGGEHELEDAAQVLRV